MAGMSDTTISLTELEEAINYWRIQRPATGEECALSPEVNALADVYAVMIIEHLHSIAVDLIGKESRQLFEAWRQARAGQGA
ncbi:DUF3717 domain-containing protein [Herbaspirillum hiltneri]|nr:DUF3717 domain-containing protein [Herbaspirillum hiltneri]